MLSVGPDFSNYRPDSYTHFSDKNSLQLQMHMDKNSKLGYHIQIALVNLILDLLQIWEWGMHHNYYLVSLQFLVSSVFSI